MKPDSCNGYSSNQQSSYNNNNSCDNNRIRVIRLRRRSNIPLGFSVRGGREHGTGIFVSEVKAGSEAHHQGLLVGDQILRINGFNIEHAIHDEVLALLRAKPGVVIKVKSMGMIPVKDTKKDPLTWKIVDPGPSSPEYNGKVIPNSIGTEGIETRLSIPAIGTSGLGCSIVKGPPDTPGIYVQSVKSCSLAEKAGLQVGDRIMEMNGHNFTNLDFADAVAVLKSSKQMSLVLCKGVGLDLFPEEKLRRISEAHIAVKHGDITKLSSVPEEDPRDDRDAKKTNGHIYRVKNCSEIKRPNEWEIKRNGNSSCSESDVSCQPFNQDINQTKLNSCVKVRATVHSSSGDEESIRLVRNSARESGDGMDFEYMNSNRNVPKSNGQFWNTGKHDFSDGQMKAKTQNIIQLETDTCSEDESCSSSLTQEKEIFKENDTSRHTQFLSEIQLHGDKSSVTSDEKSELSSLSSDDYLGIPKISTRAECVKPPNEFFKRKQHELLMEEFREVHKKMFGHGPPRLTKPPKQPNNECQDPSGQYKRRQQVRKDKVMPPPPPPPDIDGQFIKSEAFCSFNRVESIEDLCDTDEKILHRKRQREPPITDSRDPEPKPPQTYFENGPKPLVTIGTYSNSNQQNRFINNDVTNVKLKQNHFETKLPFSSKLKELTFTVHQNLSSSSSSSTVPSSSSSEPRSPTSESVVSSDSLFNSNSTSISKGSKQSGDDSLRNMIETVPNSYSFQVSLSQFSKNETKAMDNNKIQNLKNLSNRVNKITSNKIGQTIKKEDTDLSKEILEIEAEGRETKNIILKKNGPLNFRVEGGINSDLAGRILVSEVWAGSCITEGGKIELGDQILMVDDTKLNGLSLTAANVALRNANANSNKEMKLIIAKSLKENMKELKSLEI